MPHIVRRGHADEGVHKRSPGYLCFTLPHRYVAVMTMTMTMT
jgi:hypothetical protein